jgi:hypothetical protein
LKLCLDFVTVYNFIKGDLPWYASVNKPSGVQSALTVLVLQLLKQDLKRTNWTKAINSI